MLGSVVEKVGNNSPVGSYQSESFSKEWVNNIEYHNTNGVSRLTALIYAARRGLLGEKPENLWRHPLSPVFLEDIPCLILDTRCYTFWISLVFIVKREKRLDYSQINRITQSTDQEHLPTLTHQELQDEEHIYPRDFVSVNQRKAAKYLIQSCP